MVDAVGANDLIPVLGPGGLRMVSPATVIAAPVAQAAAVQSALTALAARVAALEAKPEEVAHFGAAAAMPNVLALASFTLTLTGLAPARSGDVLKAGESVTVTPLAALPDGVAMKGPPTVPADGTVLLRFSSSIALTGGALIPWAISALR